MRPATRVCKSVAMTRARTFVSTLANDRDIPSFSFEGGVIASASKVLLLCVNFVHEACTKQSAQLCVHRQRPLRTPPLSSRHPSPPSFARIVISPQGRGLVRPVRKGYGSELLRDNLAPRVRGLFSRFVMFSSPCVFLATVVRLRKIVVQLVLFFPLFWLGSGGFLRVSVFFRTWV